jgi:hypothetical protein
MAKRYSPEFKAEAVRLILEEDMTQAQVSRDLGVPRELGLDFHRPPHGRLGRPQLTT